MLRGRSQAALWLAAAAGAALAWLAQQPRAVPAAVMRGDERATSSLALESTALVERAPSLPEPLTVAAGKAGLDPALVLAVIEAESGHDPAAISSKGAVGLMQILPETAALMGFAEFADPATNLEVGCLYLASLIERFGGDVELALAAYNAGPGAVRRWGTIPPYRETRAFVTRVREIYRETTGLELSTAARFGPEPLGLL